MNLQKCKECGHDVSSNLDFVNKTGLCPKCGANVKVKKSINKGYIFLLIGILIVIVIITLITVKI